MKSDILMILTIAMCNFDSTTIFAIVSGFGLAAAAAAGVRTGYPTVLQSHYG